MKTGYTLSEHLLMKRTVNEGGLRVERDLSPSTKWEKPERENSDRIAKRIHSLTYHRPIESMLP